MPPPSKPSFWPFLKELIFNNQPITEFIKNNKLLSFSILLNLVFFMVCLFSMEQSIQKAKTVTELKTQLQHKPVQPTGFNSCSEAVTRVEELYKKLYKLYNDCQNAPSPIPYIPVPKKEPAIPTRAQSSDDSLKRKLDAIR